MCEGAGTTKQLPRAAPHEKRASRDFLQLSQAVALLQGSLPPSEDCHPPFLKMCKSQSRVPMS